LFGTGAMNDFIAPGWEAILRRNGLGNFEDVWNIDLPLYEPANHRRGGWSNVVKAELNAESTDAKSVFIKRQENHTRRTLRHPIMGQSTYQCELHNIRRFAEIGVPTVTPIYFAQRRIGGNLRAVMITEALNGFRSLDDWMHDWEADGWPSREVRRLIFNSVARTLNALHARRVQHSSLYPKHIFIKLSNRISNVGAELAVRLIDLESSRRRLMRRWVVSRDFDSLNRHAPRWSRTDRLRFLLSYFDNKKMTPDAKRLFRRIAAMAGAKKRRSRVVGAADRKGFATREK
jgi:hypothetical protein